VIITDTWSQSLSAGLSLGDASSNLVLNTSGTQAWQNSQSQLLADIVQMTIPSNSQGALVAQVMYNSTNGTMQIGNELPFPVVANQPQSSVEYVANIIPCNSQFNANFTPSPESEGLSAGAAAMKPNSHAIVAIVIMVLAVRVLL